MEGVLRPAAFFDRDGTIIREIGYLSRPEQVELLPGAAQAIARLNSLEIPVVVATNQAGVARGYFSIADVAAVHARLDELLAADGARIERYYFCPHHPQYGEPPWRQQCACRKPRPGLLLRAAEELGLDLSRSCMIGDKLLDLAAGAAASCRTLLVRTGYGREEEAGIQPQSVNLMAVADDLSAAVDAWLGAQPAS